MGLKPRASTAYRKPAKTTAREKDHFDRLVKGGVIVKPDQFEADHIATINRELTADQVDALIKIKGKLFGSGPPADPLKFIAF